jgi:RNA polymerase sigma-70 factor (ECF subfamily)
VTPERQRRAEFVNTDWTLVRRAARKSDRTSQWRDGAEALNELCQIYREPIVAFCRRSLDRRNDAEDIAQVFLLGMAHGRFLKSVDQHKGKFRTFVLASLKNLVFDLLDREKATKRGGEIQIEALPDDLGEGAPVVDKKQLSADVLFDIQWAITLAKQALEKLQKKFENQGRLKRFSNLRPFLVGKVQGAEARDAAALLETTPANFHVYVGRFRKEYSEILRQEVARTVSAPHEIESELRYLISLLGQSKWSL